MTTLYNFNEMPSNFRRIFDSSKIKITMPLKMLLCVGIHKNLKLSDLILLISFMAT